MPEQLPPAAPRLSHELSGISDAVRALVVAIDEVDEAEHELDQRVRTQFGVNATDIAVLQYIDRLTRRGRPALARDIATRFGRSSGSATEIVHRLEHAGLLRRIPDPHDARNRELHLTPHATEQLDELVGDIRTSLNSLLLQISDDEEARLIELLNTVRDIYRGLNRDDTDPSPNHERNNP